MIKAAINTGRAIKSFIAHFDVLLIQIRMLFVKTSGQPALCQIYQAYYWLSSHQTHLLVQDAFSSFIK
jgi:hypothetical protein